LTKEGLFSTPLGFEKKLLILGHLFLSTYKINRSSKTNKGKKRDDSRN